jgi:hypothetical protein
VSSFNIDRKKLIAILKKSERIKKYGQEEEMIDRMTNGITDLLESIEEIQSVIKKVSRLDINSNSGQIDDLLEDLNSPVGHMLYHVSDMKVFEFEIERNILNKDD